MDFSQARDSIRPKFHDMFLDMIDAAPMSIVIADSSAHIEYVNSHFSKLTGYGFDEALGSNPSILKSGQTPPGVYHDLWSHLLRGESWKGEFINRKKDGGIYIEIASIFPVIDKEGAVHYVAFKIDGTEQKKLQELVNLDPLTNLFNRFYLSNRLQTELDAASAEGKPFSLIFIDLDRFKGINDQYGHQAGDEALLSASRLLRAAVPTEGWIARYGGDEFVVCLPGMDSSAARAVAERLRADFSGAIIDCCGSRVEISCSIGMHTLNPGSEAINPEALMHLADQKMYEAKIKGGNKVSP